MRSNKHKNPILSQFITKSQKKCTILSQIHHKIPKISKASTLLIIALNDQFYSILASKEHHMSKVQVLSKFHPKLVHTTTWGLHHFKQRKKQA